MKPFNDGSSFLAFLLLLTLHPHFRSASAELSSAEAPSPSVPEYVSSSNQSKYWIVEGNASGRIIPSCSDLCVSSDVPSYQSLDVMLQPCQGLAQGEFWQYNEQTKAIIATGYGGRVNLCLDASDQNQFQLNSCAGNASQTWTWEEDTRRFRSELTSQAGAALYMRGDERNATEWGSGKRTWSLNLGTEDSGGILNFTMLAFYNPFYVRPSESSANSGYLVSNGGFEKCGMDPGNGFVTLGITQPIPLCSWLIVSNEVEYSSNDLWQSGTGNHILHLNSAALAQPAAVTQVLAAKTGSNYSLSFYLSGNPDSSCGSSNKTMKVEVSSSSLATQFMWFDISNGDKGSLHGPIGFTALGQYLNLTFTSLTSGSCGPVIDNVTVQEVNGPLPAAMISDKRSSSSIPVYAIILIGLSAAGITAGVVFLLLYVRKKQASKEVQDPTSSDVLSSRLWDSVALSQLSGSSVKELTWKELEKATKNFTTVIGEGGFSTVYRGEFPDGIVGAVKIEKHRERARDAFRQEISILGRIRHENLVNLIGLCNEREEGILVFEYMPNGNLHQRLHLASQYGHGVLPWYRRMAIAFQIACALEYLHEVARPPVVHSDIKSANVLLDEKDKAKLCDFGFSSKAGPNSSVFHSTVTSVVKGSLGYLDPNFYKTGVLSKKSDVYSFGVLLMELVTGLLAFDLNRAEVLPSFVGPYLKDMDMMSMIVDPVLSGFFDRQELALICQISDMCIKENTGLRPSMTQVVQMLKRGISVATAANAQIQLED